MTLKIKTAKWIIMSILIISMTMSITYSKNTENTTNVETEKEYSVTVRPRAAQANYEVYETDEYTVPNTTATTPRSLSTTTSVSDMTTTAKTTTSNKTTTTTVVNTTTPVTTTVITTTSPNITTAEEQSILYSGDVLTPSKGVNYFGDQKETYYNLDMTTVINVAHNKGYTGDYWVRSDGCKMFGNYIIIAANYTVHPYGSIVNTSLGEGIVLDTGGFAYNNSTQVDIAVTW